MIAVDTNVLVYAHRAESPFYEVAEGILRELTGSHAQWAIPWPCVHEFFGVVTHPRVYAPPTPADMAIQAVTALLGAPNLVLLVETERHWPTLRGLLGGGRIVGPRIHDARIAALCIEHGVSALWSADRDFSRFPALTVVNPLVS